MPEIIDNSTDGQARKVENFLVAPERPQGHRGLHHALRLPVCRGLRSRGRHAWEWLPVVFDEQDPMPSFSVRSMF